MKLGAKQEVFTEMQAKLVLFMVQMGYGCRGKEWLRTKEQAAWYAARGLGIKNSNHCNGLARDIYWSKNGKLVWKGELYQIAANYWKAMVCEDLEFCWGGDFRRRDVYHYSIKHRGVV